MSSGTCPRCDAAVEATQEYCLECGLRQPRGEGAFGRMSAGYGLFLRGDGKGAFTPVLARESGFVVPGQARDIQRIRIGSSEAYVVTRNNDRPLVFKTRISNDRK